MKPKKVRVEYKCPEVIDEMFREKAELMGFDRGSMILQFIHKFVGSKQNEELQKAIEATLPQNYDPQKLTQQLE